MRRLTMTFTAAPLVFVLVFATACGGSTAAPQPTVTAAPASTTTSAPTATVAAATDTPEVTAEVIATAETVATEATTAATSAATAESIPATAGDEQDFAPTVPTVFNTAIGPDQMTGTCNKGSMLPVYGLVQITPEGDGLSWKSQEPAPYMMSRLQVNQYQYSGPTALKDGVVTMTLQFLSDKELEMIREFVPAADPACTHTHLYTGTFQWERP